MQSPSSPQATFVGHMGAHAGAAHVLATHSRDPQSALEPHGVPSAHEPMPIAHPGEWQTAF